MENKIYHKTLIKLSVIQGLPLQLPFEVTYFTFADDVKFFFFQLNN